ncbi:MAG TPA: protein kinase [Candidatus Acidoferrum sp.]|nr:protein kinase [Candidatus Acidoferrum sp.]
MENSPEMNQDIVGSRRGDYEILALLGTGGMGQVFKVRNVHSDRIEAMKVLLPNLADQKNLADRFMQEIKVLAGLHHPNIAELRTALTINNQLVMIMEYVEGTTLAARIQQGSIPYGQALDYTGQVLSALSYAHQQHIIHRDIKPSNMMLTPEGVVKLMDFGIAQRGDQGDLTRTNTTVGSFAYMSPEQIKGEAVDGRSDLYSVGVSLYEMVTGQRPFPSDTAFSAMQAHLQTPPRPPIELRPDLPPALSQLIVMAVAKDPTGRFQTADAFAAALQSIAPKVAATVAAIPVPVVPPALAPQGTRPSGTVAAAAAAGASATKVATAAPVAVPTAQEVPMPPPVAQKTHRGLYITLGAVIVFAVIAAAAVVPWHAKSAAFKKQSARPTEPSATQPAPAPAPGASARPSTDAAAPATTPATPSSPNAPPAPLPTPPPLPTADAQGNPAGSAAPSQPAPAQPSPSAPVAAHHRPAAPNMPPPSPSPMPAPSGQSGTGTNAPPPGVDPAEELKAVDLENDQLSSRASAVNASLDTLQKQQAAAGYGLRGDIVASQQRMQNYLAKAQAALDRQDAAGAKKYLDLAAAEVEKIEKFLGR